MSDSAILIGTMGIYFIIGIVSYFIGAIPFYVLAKKASDRHPWFAFIPFLNIIQMLRIARINLWFLLLLLIPFVNIIMGFYMMYRYLKAYGRSGVGILILFIPLVNYIYLFYLAFSDYVHYELDYSPTPPGSSAY